MQEHLLRIGGRHVAAFGGLADHQRAPYPYGGMKSSGLGREGIRYAVEEMTETTFVGIKLGEAR